MKKINLLSGLCIAMTMIGCSQDELQNIEVAESAVTATISDAATTRTMMDADGKVLWLSGDDISLMLKAGYHNRYVVSGAVNSNATTFAQDPSTAEIALNKVLPSHYAVYPYNSGITVSDDANSLTVDVSGWANQSYTEGTFEDDKAIMTAKSTNLNLAFKNAFSLFEFKLSSKVSGSYSISSISVTSAAHALNGTATIDMSLTEPYLACTGTAAENKTNTLSLSSPIMLTQTPKAFYLLVPVGTYEPNDLTITFAGTNELDGTPISKSVNPTFEVECFRSKKTTINKVFEAVEFSGSTEDTNQ